MVDVNKFHELIYDSQEVADWITKKYPSAVIRDASDYIHEERFEVDIPNCDDYEFYKFAFDMGFIGSCLIFRLRCGTSKDKKDDVVEKILVYAKACKEARDKAGGAK